MPYLWKYKTITHTEEYMSMDFGTLIPTLTALSGLIVGGGGIMYARSNVKREQSSAKQAVNQADVDESKAFAERISLLSGELRASSKRLGEMDEALEKSAGKVRTLLSQVDQLEKQVTELKTTLAGVERERDAAMGVIEQQKQRIETLEQLRNLLEDENRQLKNQARTQKARTAKELKDLES